MITLHYFDQEQADASDFQLGMSKAQGYVPQSCLLGGATVWSEVQKGHDPCAGCNCDRDKCHGRPRQ